MIEPVTKIFKPLVNNKSPSYAYYRFPYEWLNADTVEIMRFSDGVTIRANGLHKVTKTSLGRYGQVKMQRGILPETKYYAKFDGNKITLVWGNK